MMYPDVLGTGFGFGLTPRKINMEPKILKHQPIKKWISKSPFLGSTLIFQGVTRVSSLRLILLQSTDDIKCLEL